MPNFNDDFHDFDSPDDLRAFEAEERLARELERGKLRKKHIPTGHWLTAQNELIAFKDMEHRHLLNTIAYVERKYREIQDTFCDAALDINLIYPQHAGLVAEARRRNLLPAGKKNELVTG